MSHLTKKRFEDFDEIQLDELLDGAQAASTNKTNHSVGVYIAKFNAKIIYIVSL